MLEMIKLEIVKRCAEKGISNADTGYLLDISESNVKSIKRVHAIKSVTTNKDKQGTRLDNSRIALEAFMDNKNIVDIARDMKLSRATIRNYLTIYLTKEQLLDLKNTTMDRKQYLKEHIKAVYEKQFTSPTIH